MQKKIRILLTAIVAVLLMTGCAAGEQPKMESVAKGDMKVSFIYIGQGDATLIQTADAAMLIDTGEYDEKDKLLEGLEQAGVEELDYLILTHPDADHIGAGDVVIDKFKVDHVIMPELERSTKAYTYTMEAIEDQSIEVIDPEIGREYELGDAKFMIIAPYEVEEDESNNASVGIKLVHGDNTFVFTGDAEQPAEKEMVQGNIDLECDVLKCGHHGSRTATSDAFLEAADPTWAVISCGQENQYGFPHSEVIAKLEDDDVQIYRTDTMGTVTAVSDGQNISWNGSGSNQKKPADKKEEPQEKADEKQEQPDEVTYVLNTNTKKVHRPECSSAASISEKNREETTKDLGALEEEGYVGCKQCKP